MKTVFILFYSYKSDVNFEFVRLYQNEEDATKALEDARANKEIYGAYCTKVEIHERYHNEMKEKYNL